MHDLGGASHIGGHHGQPGGHRLHDRDRHALPAGGVDERRVALAGQQLAGPSVGDVAGQLDPGSRGALGGVGAQGLAAGGVALPQVRPAHGAARARDDADGVGEAVHALVRGQVGQADDVEGVLPSAVALDGRHPEVADLNAGAVAHLRVGQQEGLGVARDRVDLVEPAHEAAPPGHVALGGVGLVDVVGVGAADRRDGGVVAGAQHLGDAARVVEPVAVRHERPARQLLAVGAGAGQGLETVEDVDGVVELADGTGRAGAGASPFHPARAEGQAGGVARGAALPGARGGQGEEDGGRVAGQAAGLDRAAGGAHGDDPYPLELLGEVVDLLLEELLTGVERVLIGEDDERNLGWAHSATPWERTGQ